MTTKVLVTGAAGFLGRWFVRHHLAAGDLVIGIDDLSNEHSVWPDELPARQRINSDVAKWMAWNSPHFDLAYHFAAPVGGRVKIEGDPLFNADSLRIDSTFFRWAVGKVGIAIYPSSSAVYGVQLQGEDAQDLHESMFKPGGSSWLAPDEMYGFTKLVGERLAWAAQSYGLNTLCIRPFSGYGEGQSMEYPVPSILARAKRREDPILVWGTGQQARDFVHVEDVVGATIARLNRGISGYQNMNIGSGKTTTFYHLAQMAANIAGYHPLISVDVSKPAGVSTRRAEPTRMLTYYRPTVTLEAGISRVLDSL